MGLHFDLFEVKIFLELKLLRFLEQWTLSKKYYQTDMRAIFSQLQWHRAKLVFRKKVDYCQYSQLSC